MTRCYRYILILILLLTMSPAVAQTELTRKTLRKELRSKMKSDKFGDADNQLRKAMEEHPELRDDAEFNHIGATIHDKLAEEESRKIFLGSKPDTAKYFSHIYEVYRYSLATGYGVKKYRRQLSGYLMRYRNNLRSAGVFHFKKSQYPEAFKYFDMYLATTDYPLLVHDKAYRADPDTVLIARLASISAFGAKDYGNSLFYLDMALDDTTNIANMLEIGVKSGLAKGDTVAAFEYMEKGWNRDHTSQFFCFALLDYYQQKHDYSNVLSIISESLRTMPKDSSVISRLYYIQGKSYEIIDREDEALTAFDSTSVYAPLDAKPYYSKGVIYLRRARHLAETTSAQPGTNAYNAYKKRLSDIYDSALAAFEKVKERAPDQPSMWFSGLRECYYKLNKGKELKQIEQYEKKP